MRQFAIDIFGAPYNLGTQAQIVGTVGHIRNVY